MIQHPSHPLESLVSTLSPADDIIALPQPAPAVVGDSALHPIPCRSCGTETMRLLLDLGSQPLANALLKSPRRAPEEKRHPLRLFLCEECRMLQIGETVDPQVLFESYLYFSSCSSTLLRHASEAVSQYVESFNLGADSFVVEVASNDGYLLRNFVDRGIPCLGIEPARNIAEAASRDGIPTLNRFFNADLAEELAVEGRQADLILGSNVLAHVPDINGFVEGVSRLLKPGGRAVFEFPYALDLLEKCEFDTIYHEHVFYFTLTALLPLFQRHGLTIFHAEKYPIHGGSLRVFVARPGDFEKTDRYFQLLGIESLHGVSGAEFYAGFARRVRAIREELVRFLNALKALGKRIAAYGASAKGAVLLNYAGIGGETLDFVVDKNPHKQGLYTPGSHLPILPPEALLERRPDFTLLLTWNFADEILAEQMSYREKGGKFIIPIPKLNVC